jgi:hypothetical protein
MPLLYHRPILGPSCNRYKAETEESDNVATAAVDVRRVRQSGLSFTGVVDGRRLRERLAPAAVAAKKPKKRATEVRKMMSGCRLLQTLCWID